MTERSKSSYPPRSWATAWLCSFRAAMASRQWRTVIPLCDEFRSCPFSLRAINKLPFLRSLSQDDRGGKDPKREPTLLIYNLPGMSDNLFS